MNGGHVETVRIYGAATVDQQVQVDMYLKQGFDNDDATTIMEKALPGAPVPRDSRTVCIRANTLETELTGPRSSKTARGHIPDRADHRCAQ